MYIIQLMGGGYYSKKVPPAPDTIADMTDAPAGSGTYSTVHNMYEATLFESKREARKMFPKFYWMIWFLFPRDAAKIIELRDDQLLHFIL